MLKIPIAQLPRRRFLKRKDSSSRIDDSFSKGKVPGSKIEDSVLKGNVPPSKIEDSVLKGEVPGSKIEVRRSTRLDSSLKTGPSSAMDRSTSQSPGRASDRVPFTPATRLGAAADCKAARPRQRRRAAYYRNPSTGHTAAEASYPCGIVDCGVCEASTYQTLRLAAHQA
jgi:hypothetical protein